MLKLTAPNPVLSEPALKAPVLVSSEFDQSLTLLR